MQLFMLDKSGRIQPMSDTETRALSRSNSTLPTPGTRKDCRRLGQQPPVRARVHGRRQFGSPDHPPQSPHLEAVDALNHRALADHHRDVAVPHGVVAKRLTLGAFGSAGHS